ncbi:lysozyme [Agrobacterium vitis]|uniref:lysozyme n=1 Tax=Agrobacterium vitis TaxID=373 RepID=UPI002035958D|nr:lysozyme [Agrobacterium vitis]MCM2451931.1 lysozyme [Agrobacterium vitis]
MPPINKIKPTPRAKAAIAAATAAVIAGGSATYFVANEPVPVSVQLAVDAIITPWEGLVLKSHWDTYSKRYDICYGETKGIGPNMVKTKRECREMLIRRVVNDFYKPLTKCIAGFEDMPNSLQASMISGAYNFGVGASCNSTAARYARVKRYQEACHAQTAFNKAGGGVVQGLVNRREMGDTSRIGESELCVSGLADAR